MNSPRSAAPPRTKVSRVLVIVNPVAGQHSGEEKVERLRGLLDRHGVTSEIRCTEGEGDALRLAREARDVDVILVMGGDGTVMEALTGMLKNPHPVPLAQVPAGTANLLCRALAIPSDMEEAVELAVGAGDDGGVVVSTDVGYLPDHDRYFMIMAGAGWDADMLADATRGMKDRLGFFAYLFSGIKNLFTLKTARVRATIDGEQVRFRANTIMVVNVGEIYGSGLALGEDLSPHDGRLNLVVASPRTAWGLVKAIALLLMRRVTESKDLHYFSASRIEIHTSRPLRLELDGDLVGETPFRVEVVAAAAHLVVPRRYAEAKSLPAEPLGAPE